MLLYKLITGACLALTIKIAFVPDWPSVAALFVFSLSGLAVYFLERTNFSEPIKNLSEEMQKVKAHLERLDNRTRPAGR